MHWSIAQILLYPYIMKQVEKYQRQIYSYIQNQLMETHCIWEALQHWTEVSSQICALAGLTRAYLRLLL
jgi:hypothetical protein